MKKLFSIDSKGFASVLGRAIKDLSGGKSLIAVLHSVLLVINREGVWAATCQHGGAAYYSLEYHLGNGFDCELDEGLMIPHDSDEEEFKDEGIIVKEPRKLWKWLRAGRGRVSVAIGGEPYGDRVIFERSGRRLSLRAFDKETFPVSPFLSKEWNEKSEKIGILSEEMLRMWGPRLSAVMSDDEDRAYVYGVGFDKGRLEAGDGYRMNLLKVESIEGCKLDEKIDHMIPAPVWKRIVEEASLRKGSGEVELSKYKGWMKFKFQTDHFRFIRIPETTSPPVDRMIPHDVKLTWTPDRSALVSLAKEASALTTKNSSKSLKVNVNPEAFKVLYRDVKEGVELSAVVKGKINLLDSDYKPEEIGLNLFYLLDALEPFKNPTFGFSGPLDAVIVTEEGNPLLHILMPIRT